MGVGIGLVGLADVAACGALRRRSPGFWSVRLQVYFNASPSEGHLLSDLQQTRMYLPFLPLGQLRRFLFIFYFRGPVSFSGLRSPKLVSWLGSLANFWRLQRARMIPPKWRDHSSRVDYSTTKSVYPKYRSRWHGPSRCRYLLRAEVFAASWLEPLRHSRRSFLPCIYIMNSRQMKT